MAAAASNQPLIIFDEFSKLRILDPTQFETSENLKDECKDFTSKVNNFNDTIQSFLKMMEEKAQQIEKEKLKAIGLRNRAEQESENRKRTQKQLQSLIKERQAELDRSEMFFAVWGNHV
ncbi:intraflagellar transport protein 20 [Phlyctochytrium arcticum]|nr:intraflagellar transport protein 20 [Phlyctochytrium arcticum]